MLISALQSTIDEKNSLNLPAKRSVCVILVDGLGSHNLKNAGAHAGFLNSQSIEAAMCWFPATTSTSISSFATASNPWENGFLGYQVFDRPSGNPMNLLSGWTDFEAGSSFQEQETISEKAVANQIEFHTVAPEAYETSGFTGATMREGAFHGEDEIENRFSLAASLLRNSTAKVVYLYIPELDQLAHSRGVLSTAWLNKLEDLDSLVSSFTSKLPKNVGVLLTADHGVVDIEKEDHVFVDEIIPSAEFDFVGGDTRALYLYFKSGVDIQRMREMLVTSLADSCYIATPNEVIDAGYWKPLSQKSLVLAPDLLVLARRRVALYHRGFAKKKSLEMVGHHGSISSEELSIPIIRFGF